MNDVEIIRLNVERYRRMLQSEVTSMNDVEIIRLNVERYRRMLQTEADESARRAIQQILNEFDRLSLARPRSNRAAELDLHQS